VYPFGETLHYADTRADAPADTVAADVRGFLTSRGFAGVTVEPATPTVEDAFIARMGALDAEAAPPEHRTAGTAPRASPQRWPSRCTPRRAASAISSPSIALRSTSAPAKCSASSAPTAPARRRRSGC